MHQLSISLDYLDERHDIARGIPGLVNRIFGAVSDMRTVGVDNVRFNTVIKNDNVDQIMPIVRRAASLGYGVNLSVYTDSKNGNRDHLIEGIDSSAMSNSLIAEVLAFKRSHRRAISKLRVLPRADTALFARRAPRTVPLGNAHRPHRPDRQRQAVSGFSDRFSLARLQTLQADRLQRVFLRMPAVEAEALPLRLSGVRKTCWHDRAREC